MYQISNSELEKNNILIADFMGEKRYGFKNEQFLIGSENITARQLGYHHSWSWLMPVIEKISSTKITYKNVNETYFPYPRTFGMKTKDNLSLFRFNAGSLFEEKRLIDAAYRAVIEFIKNYNNGNTNNNRTT